MPGYLHKARMYIGESFNFALGTGQISEREMLGACGPLVSRSAKLSEPRFGQRSFSGLLIFLLCFRVSGSGSRGS